MLDQNVAAVARQLRVLHLHQLETECAALFREGPPHARRVEFAHLGRQQRGPARLAVARLPHQRQARAEFQQRRGLGLVVGVEEGQQLDVELARHFAQQVVDAHGAAVRERVGEIGREHGHAAALGRGGAAFHGAITLGDHRALALGPRPPPGAQINAVERHAAPEQERGQIEPQVVAFEARVVSQDLARRQLIRRAAQGAGLARQHHRDEADAIALELEAQLRPILFRRQEVAAVGNQLADFLRHAPAQLGIAGREGDDHRFRVFAQQLVEPLFQVLT